MARDRARIVAEDILRTPDARTDLVRSYGIQAYCCHPLKAADRLFGTLSFGTRTRPRFKPDEVQLMRIVADQVSVAMERILARKNLEEALADTSAGQRTLQALMEHVPEGITIAYGLTPGSAWSAATATRCSAGRMQGARPGTLRAGGWSSGGTAKPRWLMRTCRS